MNTSTTPSAAIHRGRRRRGAMLIYVSVIAVPMFGLLSLGLDYGRVLGARGELQTALDAAARYGVTGLADGTATSRAIAAASANTVDGAPLTIDASHITAGRYDAATGTFIANAANPNALRVSDRASPHFVETIAARAIGIQHIAISAESYAMLGGGAATSLSGSIRGFVGLDWFNINGPLNVRAWDSSTQTVPDSNTAWAAGQTRGPANLNSGVKIFGELQTSGNVSMNQATITQGIKPLPSGFGNFPMPASPSGATYLGNYNGPSGASQTFPAGVYRFDTFNVPSGKTVTFSGPASIYVNGSLNLNGVVNTSGNLPSNLKLYNTSGSGMDIGSNATSPIYAELYAPNSPMNLNQRTFYGSMIVKGINVNSTFNMYIDGRAEAAGQTTSTATGTQVLTIWPQTRQ